MFAGNLAHTVSLVCAGLGHCGMQTEREMWCHFDFANGCVSRMLGDEWLGHLCLKLEEMGLPLQRGVVMGQENGRLLVKVLTLEALPIPSQKRHVNGWKGARFPRQTRCR